MIKKVKVSKEEMEFFNFPYSDFKFNKTDKKYYMPLFYDEYILKQILDKTDYAKYNSLLKFYAIKYSGLFELGYDIEGEYSLCLKEEYKNYGLNSFAEIAQNNYKSLKEKDIISDEEYYHGKYEETEVIKELNGEPTIIKKILYEFLQTKLENYKTKSKPEYIMLGGRNYIFSITSLYFRLINNISKIEDNEFTYLYIILLKHLNTKHNKFIKFSDKKYIKEEDFLNLKNKMKLELEKRIGNKKIDEIINKTNGFYDFDEIKKIVNESLIKKIKIDDEIKKVQEKKNKTLKSTQEYRVLNQRLNKLLLYKNHFDSEEVINGEGVFKDCYGFIFDNIYVFDFFSDLDESDVLKKANKDYGHRLYILTSEDYIKLKDLKSRNEVNKYIRDNLEPCADTMNHGINEEKRLLEKIDKVKKSIKRKNYIINLSKTDNPVTDEEIFITKEEFDYYVSKYISQDEEVIKKLRDKSNLFKTKESIEREKYIKQIEFWKSKQETVSDEEINESDKEILNEEIETKYHILEIINAERIKNNLEPLSFEKSNYYDIYKTLLDYEEKNNIPRKSRRDPNVALITKERTFYNNAYHCELCGCSEINPIYLDSHHFIPISQNGPDDIYNTVCLCVRCHRRIHNGLVTDYQNYQLINTIKDYIISRVPEALPYFEKTLGFKENKYLEQIDKTDSIINDTNIKYEEAYDKDLPDNEILDELERLQSDLDNLEERKRKLLILANKIQDYYRYSEEYKHIEDKTNNLTLKK